MGALAGGHWSLRLTPDCAMPVVSPSTSPAAAKARERGGGTLRPSPPAQDGLAAFWAKAHSLPGELAQVASSLVGRAPAPDPGTGSAPATRKTFSKRRPADVAHPARPRRSCAICLEDGLEPARPPRGGPPRGAAERPWFVCMPAQGAAAASGCCGTEICRACMSRYLTLSISDGKQLLRCPGQCRRSLADGEVKQFVNERQMQRFRNRLRLSENPRLRECAACGHLTPGSAMAPDMSCGACGEKFCFHHGNAHPGVSCWSYVAGQDVASLGRAADSQWRTQIKLYMATVACPQCHARVSKDGGCDMVTCVCGTAFCWRCGKPFDAKHRRFWSLRCRSPYVVARKTAVVVLSPAIAGLVVVGACVVLPVRAVAACVPRRETDQQRQIREARQQAKERAKEERRRAREERYVPVTHGETVSCGG